MKSPGKLFSPELGKMILGIDISFVMFFIVKNCMDFVSRDYNVDEKKSRK